MHADIGWDEVALRIGLDQRVLGARRRLAPRGPSAIVTIVAHREDLVADAEGWIADAGTLRRLRKGEADRAQPLEQGLLIGHGESLRGSALRTSHRPLIQLEGY